MLGAIPLEIISVHNCKIAVCTAIDVDAEPQAISQADSV